MAEKNGNNRIYLIIAIVGSLASGFGGFYGGQANTASQIAELKITDASRNEKIANLIKNEEHTNKPFGELMNAINENTETLNTFLMHYAATTGTIVK